MDLRGGAPLSSIMRGHRIYDKGPPSEESRVRSRRQVSTHIRHLRRMVCVCVTCRLNTSLKKSVVASLSLLNAARQYITASMSMTLFAGKKT